MKGLWLSVVCLAAGGGGHPSPSLRPGSPASSARHGTRSALLALAPHTAWTHPLQDTALMCDMSRLADRLREKMSSQLVTQCTCGKVMGCSFILLTINSFTCAVIDSVFCTNMFSNFLGASLVQDPVWAAGAATVIMHALCTLGANRNENVSNVFQY